MLDIRSMGGGVYQHGDPPTGIHPLSTNQAITGILSTEWGGAIGTSHHGIGHMVVPPQTLESDLWPTDNRLSARGPLQTCSLTFPLVLPLSSMVGKQAVSYWNAVLSWIKLPVSSGTLYKILSHRWIGKTTDRILPSTSHNAMTKHINVFLSVGVCHTLPWLGARAMTSHPFKTVVSKWRVNKLTRT